MCSKSTLSAWIVKKPLVCYRCTRLRTVGSQRHSDSCVPTLDDGVEMMIAGESYRAAGCLQASRAYAASYPSILQPARRLCTAHSSRSTRDLPARSRPDVGRVLVVPPVGAVLSSVAASRIYCTGTTRARAGNWVRNHGEVIFPPREGPQGVKDRAKNARFPP